MTVYSLDRLAKPGSPFVLLPHCCHLAVKYDGQEPIALAAASKSKVLAWEWTGSRAGQPGTESVKTGLLDFSSLFALSSPLVEKTLAGHELELSFAQANRSRGLSFLFSSNANAAKGEQEADLSSIPCVTRLDWAGDLLSVSVVHAVNVPVLDEEEEEEAHLQVLDATNADLEAALGGSVGDTGFVLTYLLLHPWLDSLVRLVRAGPAPPLSANGQLQLPVAHGSPESAAAASAGHSLVSALGGSVPTSPGPNKPAPTIPLAWGAATAWRAKPKHDEDLHSSSAHALSAVSRLKLPVRPAVGLDPAVLRLNASHTELEQTARLLDAGIHEYLGGEEHASNDAQLVLALTLPTEDGPRLGSALLSLQGTPVQDPCRFASGGGMSSNDDTTLGPILAFHACKSLPYIITCHTLGVTIVDVRTGQVAQSIPVQGVLGVASMGYETVHTSSSAARADSTHSARRAPSQQLGSPTSQPVKAMQQSKDVEGVEDGEKLDQDDHHGATQAQEPEPTHGSDYADECVFICTRSGMLCLTPVPLPDQLESLLAQDPPMFDTAVQLCEGAALVSENNSTASGVPMDVDVVASRESEVRAQLGYVLFAEGRYAAGIAQLYRAGVSVDKVLALYPGACGHLAGHTVAADWCVPSITELPPHASPVQGRLQLGTALPSLLWYLHAQCVRLREAAKQDATGLTDQLGNEGSNSSKGLPPLTVIEEILVGCILLDGQLAREDARRLQDSAAKEADEDDYVSARVRSLLARAQLRQCQCISLLSHPNSTRAVAVKGLLKYYGCAQVLGEPETLALYHGKGDVEQAVSMLRSAAESAVLAGSSVGLPLSTCAWMSSEVLAESQPVVDHILALALYIRTLGNAHASIVLDVVQRMMQGRMGRIGVPLAFWILCPPTAWARAAATHGRPDTYAPLDATAVTALLQSIDVGQNGAVADHAQWWSLRGYCLPHFCDRAAGLSSLADLLACVYSTDASPLEEAPTPGVYPSVNKRVQSKSTASQDTGAEEDEEGSSHAELVRDDLRVMPPPSMGWSPSYTVAYLEYCLVVAQELGADSAVGVRVLPADGVQTLLQCYIALLAEACTSLDHVPVASLQEEKGIVRELRGRLQGLLAYVHAQPSLAAAVDAEDALELFDLAFPAGKPCGGLLFERALLLRQAGQHEQALKLLLWELQDLHAAEQYCQSLTADSAVVLQSGPSSAVSRPAGSTTDHAYNCLLATYLAQVAPSPTTTRVVAGNSDTPADSLRGVLRPNKSADAVRSTIGRVADIDNVAVDDETGLPAHATTAGHFSVSQMLLDRRLLPSTAPLAPVGSEGGHATSVTAVLDVLCRHPDSFQVSDALVSLPGGLPVTEVLPLLESTARYSKDHLRSLVVAKSFAGVSFSRAHARLVTLQSRKASVEKISTCGVCKRRVAAGGRAGPFVLHPDGMVTHVSCVSARAGVSASNGSAASGLPSVGLGMGAEGDEAVDRAGEGKGAGGRRGSRSGGAGMMEHSPGSKGGAASASGSQGGGSGIRSGAPATVKALNSGGVVW